MTEYEAKKIANRINLNTKQNATVIYDRRLDPARRMVDGFDVQVTICDVPFTIQTPGLTSKEIRGNNRS